MSRLVGDDGVVTRPTLESEGVPQICRPPCPKLAWSLFPFNQGVAMSIIWAIIIGFIVGLIAKMLMPGRDPGGFIVTTLLGIVGAVVATFLGQALGLYAAGQSAGFIASVIGAIVVLAIYNMVRGRRRVL
jgi:uncharacterized membrane protein YeaQ/YmgE (transglycosylase-associated protein family)